MTFKELGMQIWIKRRELNLTQKHLAAECGLSDATIRFIEKGDGSVSLANWVKLADKMGLDFILKPKKNNNAD